MWWQMPDKFLHLCPPRSSKVFITVATRRNVHAMAMKWTWKPWLRFSPNVVLDCEPTGMPLQHARNEQVIRFLETDCTDFFLLDSDCQPADGTIKKLLSFDLPIVAAPHRTIKGDEIGVMVLDRCVKKEELGKYRQHSPLTGLQGPSVVVGCAGLMVQRWVLEKIGPPWFENHYDERGLLTKTEDFDFCDKAHALSIPVWADCDLAQVHSMELLG